MNNRKKCFVIMPFSDTQSCTEQKWTEIFEYIIKPAVEESGLGYKCERSVAERENIIKGILEALNKANVVIADITDNNPNVFYELGVRHTLTNRTILIAQGQEHIPFDLRPYPVGFYSESPAKIAQFKSDIKKKLEDIETNPERLDNPVADFLKERNIELLSSEKKANLKKLSAFISELSRNIDNVNLIYKTASGNRELREKGREKYVPISAAQFETACLELFVSTNYITVSEDLLKDAIQLHNDLIIHKRGLDLWQNETYAEGVEQRFIDYLPSVRDRLASLLVDINEIRLDYINDNYLEPSIPAFVFSSQKHQEYLKKTK